MADWLATSLERWVDAGLLERTAAEKIRAFETDREATEVRAREALPVRGRGEPLRG